MVLGLAACASIAAAASSTKAGAEKRTNTDEEKDGAKRGNVEQQVSTLEEHNFL